MLYSTLKVSSVQDKKQCDPEEAAAKGKTAWGRGQWDNKILYFHARRGSRCSSHGSTRTTGKSQVQRAGHDQQDFPRISSLFPSHSSQCIPQEHPLRSSDNCLHGSE